MPSQSKKQRKLMGYAYACKMGYVKKCPKYIKNLADSMDIDALKDYAKTKEKNLPLYKENIIMKYYEFVNEVFDEPIKTYYKEEITPSTDFNGLITSPKYKYKL